MEHNETGCQAPLEGPVLCANNCGFFGSAATMNLCSKCHKDLALKQEQAQLAATSIGSIVNGCSTNMVNEAAVAVDMQTCTVEPVGIQAETSCVSPLNLAPKEKVKEGPNRCTTCRKRVGLTGFNCRCGDLFCSAHRYSDKHSCPYDYCSAGQNAIAKANPVVKAEKLHKI